MVKQGPAVLAVGPGWYGVVWTFFSSLISLFLSRLLGHGWLYSLRPFETYFSQYMVVSKRGGIKPDRRDKECLNNSHLHLMEAQ